MGENAEKEVGYRGEKVWQFRGRMVWECFSASDSHKMQQAFLLNKPGTDIWDGVSRRELDFINMRALPGRQALRFAPPPPEQPLVVNKKKTVEAPALELDPGDEMVQVKGLKSIAHPCMLDLTRPRFVFKHAPPEMAHQEYVWRRDLDLCEDTADLILTLSKIYAEQLETPHPELPVLANPHQTMAALSLALYRSGAAPCSSDLSRWHRPIRSSFGYSSPPPLRKGGGVGLPWRFSPKLRTVAPADRSINPRTTFSASKSSSLPDLMRSGSSQFSGARTANSHDHVVFRMLDRNISFKIVKAWDEWREAAEKGFVHGGSRAPKLDPDNKGRKSYDWLTYSNEADSRIIRMGCATATLWSALALNAESNEYIADRICLLQAPLRDGGHTAKRRFDVRMEPGLTAFEIAVMKLKDNKRAGAMILCNGEGIGGDFLSGNLTNLEEDLLMRSDLYLYLREAGHQAERNKILDTKGRPCHIPENGALVCKDVHIFRDTRETGFNPLDRPFVVPAIICTSLKNLNPHQNCSAQMRVEIAQFDPEAYLHILTAKFEMAIKAAIDNHLDVLAVSDMGSEKLHNKGDILGTAFGTALKKCRAKPPPIILSGSSAFIASLKHTIVPDKDDLPPV